MNWGIKIIAGLGTFMVFIMAMGAYMVQKDTDSLEEADYYEKSLSYDEVYEQKRNLISDSAKPTISVEGDTLRIGFQEAINRGEMTFKRPADSKLDLTIPFATTNGHYNLPISSFVKGNWHVEINWKSNGRSYIFDRSFYF